MTQQILIVSPIPSHPQFQGNSARIFRFGKLWQSKGYRVHFLYYGMEGMSPGDECRMRECWDFFYYIRPEGPAPGPAYGEYYDIDDWFDDRVGSKVGMLCDMWEYEACIVNYVWFSKALESVPEGPIKMIDTHDIFGNRHRVAEASGMKPSWFYTSRELETFGLGRADVIIAIQDEEQNYFREITDARVVVAGHVIPPHRLISRTSEGSGKLKMGFLGSGNPFNVNSMERFLDALRDAPDLHEMYELHLAGTICSSLQREDKFCVIHGLVDDASDFYRKMDLLINPMVGGTGLKIKSLEALSFGKPLLATVDAMKGIDATDEMHSCQDPEQIIHYLRTLDDSRIAVLAEHSAEAHKKYNQRFLDEFDKIMVK